MQHLLPMHDNNGSEAATQLSLNWLFQSLNSGQITWQQKPLRLSVGVPRGASGLSRECDGCDFRPPGKPLQPLKTPLFASVIWSGRTLCKSSLCASKQMDEGLPKMCQAVGVYSDGGVCAGNWSVLDLCLFINMWVLDMPSTVCPRLVLFPVDGQQQQHMQSPGSPAFIHWMSQSFHCFIITPLFSSLCLDTVAEATTNDHFLFGLIYQWLAVSH